MPRKPEEMLAREREFLAGGRWTDKHNYQGAPASFLVPWGGGHRASAVYRNLSAASNRTRCERTSEAALEEAAKHYWMESQCLCHGSLGNLEPFLVAADFPEFAKWTKDLPGLAGAVTDDVISRAAGESGPLPSQTLGIDLFTGLSGLGYGYLRLHDPLRIPSVMLLAGPP